MTKNGKKVVNRGWLTRVLSGRTDMANRDCVMFDEIIVENVSGSGSGVTS